ncbi:glycosyltransferase family 4 protein [Ghiorsea bivora]|uniref:glycosyltransferase family 4 protein n=1 Tax=Ghiorsea bivora TaxID=1485545 RepID=UPI000691D837|nr:glycosyltransferase family 4 protein [Ghiorsea bivora]
MPSLVAIVGDIQDGRTGGEQYDARLIEAAKAAGLDVQQLTWSDVISDALLRLPVLWRLAHMWRSVRLSFQLWRTSGDVLIDVWAAPYLQFWAKHTSRHILLMVHHLRGELEQDERLKTAEKTLIQAANRILTVSQSSKTQIQAYLSTESNKDIPISIIPPGFTPPNSTVKHKASVSDVSLLFVGHITRAKGVLDLLQAVVSLHVKEIWQLHIVGSTSAEPETNQQLQTMIKKHGLQDKVKLHGRVSNADLAHLYADADIFVLPSYWEGYGIVFLEAMYVGLPVVATTAGAIPEVVQHEETGLLVNAGDVDALQAALATLIRSPEQRRSYAQQAQVFAKQALDWQAVEQKFQAWWDAYVG